MMNRREFIKTAGIMTLGLMLDGKLTEAKTKMKISAVRFFDGGFMLKSFACGGGLPENSIAEEKLRSSLQNYVIDTGDEIILVDTGLPAEFEVPSVTEKSAITFGDKIADYIDALKNLGYAPERVSKILITHKHPRPYRRASSFSECKNFYLACRG